MPNSNRFMVQQAAVVSSPIVFPSTTGMTQANTVASIDSSIDLILAMLALEGTEATVSRRFLDEMSPAARITMYKILLDLKVACAV
jgi:hypothetical protein